MKALFTALLTMALLCGALGSEAEAKKGSAWGREYARCPTAVQRAESAPESSLQTKMAAAVQLCLRVIETASGLIQTEAANDSEEALEDLWSCRETLLRSEKDLFDERFGGLFRRECCEPSSLREHCGK